MTKHLPESQRRAQILKSARAEFIEKGYQSARISDVAKRAELSKGAIYFYFPSKRELFLALVMEEHDLTYSFLDKAMSEDLPALLRLLTVGANYFEYFAGLQNPPRFFLMMCELGVRDADIQEQCKALHNRFIEAVASILQQGVTEGSFRQMDTIAVAELLKAMIDGYAGQVAIDIPPNQAGLLTEGFRVILRGILVDPNQADEWLIPFAEDREPTMREI